MLKRAKKIINKKFGYNEKVCNFATAYDIAVSLLVRHASVATHNLRQLNREVTGHI